VPKRGPKPKPARERKDRIIGVRVTAAEHRKFEKLAEKLHIPLAAWARGQIMLALDYAAEKDREQDEKLAETKALVQEVRVLYQKATRDRPKRKT